MTDTQTPAVAAPLPDAATELPATAIRHPKCGGWWTGLSRSHCANCCQTFSCDSAADRHRVGQHGVDRSCAHPSEVGLVARTKPFGDLWGWPGSDDYDPTSRRTTTPAA